MVKLVEKQELRQRIFSVAQNIEQMLSPGLKISRMPDGAVLPSVDSKHFLTSLCQVGDVDNVIRSIIIKTCLRAEAIGPKCSFLMIEYLRSLLRSDLSIQQIEKNSETLVVDISKKSTQATLENLEKIIFSSVPDTAEILLEAVHLAGSECKIFIEPVSRAETSIELISGHNFKCKPDETFLKNGKWTAADAKCLIIDGVIEKISEIDSLLQKCHEEKQPMIIFARGFDKDVKTTLRVNHIRKTLNVIPVTVLFDLETANVLLDIATSIGTDVISSLKGELISTISFDEIKTIKNVTCSGSNALISSSERTHVMNHVKNLINKRNNETIPVVKQILDNRIRSLSATSVIVRIDDSGPQGAKSLNELDIGLRLVKTILSHGTVENMDFVDGSWPTTSIIAAIKLGTSLFTSLMTTNLAVIESFSLS